MSLDPAKMPSLKDKLRAQELGAKTDPAAPAVAKVARAKTRKVAKRAKKP